MMPPSMLLAFTLLPLMPMTSPHVSAAEGETCFFRQHRSVAINARQALNRAATTTDARVVQSEQACIRACCSTMVKPGAKCNMVVFNANRKEGEENCFLFHCQGEEDCPLKKALDGTNTYDIYKGLIHPTTVGPVTNSRQITTALAMLKRTTVINTTATTQTTITASTPSAPATPLSTTATTSSATATTPCAPATILSATAMTPSATAMTPATTPSAPATTPSTTATTSSATATTLPASATTPSFTTMVQSTATITPPATTKAFAPIPQSTINMMTSSPKTPETLKIAIAAMTTRTTKATSTTTMKKTIKITKKLNKIAKKTKSFPITMTTRSSTTSLPVNQIGKDTLVKTSDRLWLNRQTTTSASVTVASTTAPPFLAPSSPTPTDSTFPRSASSPSLILLPTDAAESPPAFRNSAAGDGKAAVKNRMVVMVVLALAVLVLALAVGGRKAMESFDRRHYTRLELNDLHYEV